MTENQNQHVNIQELINLEPKIKRLLLKPDAWQTLDIDYHPPRVERLYTAIDGYRVHLHRIHSTDEPCLYHKHRWPSVIKMVRGQYYMGVTYSEADIDSATAHKLPAIASFIINQGSYYEMTQTHALHYVQPYTTDCLSIMLTKEGDMYPEADVRKEALDKKLHGIDYMAKVDILAQFCSAMGNPSSKFNW